MRVVVIAQEFSVSLYFLIKLGRPWVTTGWKERLIGKPERRSYKGKQGFS